MYFSPSASKLPRLESFDDRPVERLRRIGRYDGHFRHVPLSIDREARDDGPLFDFVLDGGLRKFRIVATQPLDAAPNGRLGRRRRRRRNDGRRDHVRLGGNHRRRRRDDRFRRLRRHRNVRRRHVRLLRRRLGLLDDLLRRRRRWRRKLQLLDDRRAKRLLDYLDRMPGEPRHQCVDDECVHQHHERNADGMAARVSLLSCVIHERMTPVSARRCPKANPR